MGNNVTLLHVCAHTRIPGEEKRTQVPNRYALTFCVKGARVKCPSCGQDQDDSWNEQMFDFQLMWSCRAAVDGLRLTGGEEEKAKGRGGCGAGCRWGSILRRTQTRWK